MAARNQEKKRGGNNARRLHTKYKMYRDRKTREKNKIKRVLRSNGLGAAKRYSKQNEVSLPNIKPKKENKK